ncbi:hypothetical protein [Chryseobacterium sp. JK1]|uniref:hypothetical protein n=1 Tax=Chryseobacterium sp. JK1 TaxID=874294 RepID=UPI003D6886FD
MNTFKENIHERPENPLENRSSTSGYLNGTPKEDRWICRSIVFILGLVVLIIITGLLFSPYKEVILKLNYHL